MTAALPANLAERVLDVVRRQASAGRSVIFISHRFLEISALCDRATVLRDGETVGVVDIAPGVEEQHRRADARRPDREGPRRRPRATPAAAVGAGRPAAPRASKASASAPSSRTSPSSCATARSSASSRSRARGRTSCSARWPARVRPAGGIDRGRRAAVQFGHPADAIRAGHGAGARRPQRGAADAAVGAREHRAAVQRPLAPTGARSTAGSEAPRRRRRHRAAADRHARPGARCSASRAATSRR